MTKTPRQQRLYEAATWQEAFDKCRTIDAPIRVLVEAPCDDCCAESAQPGVDVKRIHKIYPTGHAVPAVNQRRGVDS